MAPNLVAAHQLAAAGYLIIPCYYDPTTGKKPPIHDHNHLARASSRAEDIEFWFNRPEGGWRIGNLFIKNENILIGLLTGVANGVDVIDIDIKNDLDGHNTIPGWERLAQVITETPTGGHHLIYRHNSKLRLKNDAGELIYKDKRVSLPGVDIRTTGGYVIAPGSTLPDGRMYRWHTGHLVKEDGKKYDLLTEPPVDRLVLKVWEDVTSEKEKKKRKAKLELIETPKLYEERAQTWVAKLADEVANAVPGTRDETLKSKLYSASTCVHHNLVSKEFLQSAFWQAVQACGLNNDGVTERVLEKKVDDALDSSKGKPIPEMLQKRDWLKEMNQKYFILEWEGGKCLVGEWDYAPGELKPTVRLQRFADFYNRFQGDMVYHNEEWIQKGRAWHQHPAHSQYDSLYFDPRGPEVNAKNQLNIWRGFSVDGKPGAWNRLKGHMYRVIARRDPEIYRYLIRWAAWCIQNPDRPAEVALVLRGGQGAGKGTFAREMVKLFGPHGMQITKADEIVGKFNGHLRGCCLLFADEAVSPRDAAAASILKGMLSEDKLSFRDLYTKSVQDKNVTKVIMASNDAHVTHVEHDDRRNAVFEVALDLPSVLNGRFTRSDDYFAWVHEQMKTKDALSAMLFELGAIDLGEWHPRYNIPETEARDEQKHLTKNPYVDVLADYLDNVEGQLPWMEVLALMNIPLAQLNQRHKTWLGQALRDLGWSRKQVKERADDGKRRSVQHYVKGDVDKVELQEVLTATGLKDLREIRIQEQQARAEAARAAALQEAAANADLLAKLAEETGTE